MRNIDSPYMDKGKISAFLKSSPLKCRGITQSDKKIAENDDRISNWTLSLKRTYI